MINKISNNDLYAERKKYWPAYTWKVQTSYSSAIKGKLSKELHISPDEFEKRYFYIFDKINASFYHLQRIKETQDIALEIGRMMTKIKFPGTEHMFGLAGVTYEPISYEYEAFLIKLKSSLDFIAILLTISFNRKEDNIGSLLKSIKNRKKEKNLEERVYSLLESTHFTSLLESFKNPSQTERSKRNFATHEGSLPTGTINLPLDHPEVPILLSKVLDPNQPDPHISLRTAPDLIKYCEEQFYQTCDLLIEILSLFTGTKLASGPKMSIYEYRYKNQANS